MDLSRDIKALVTDFMVLLEQAVDRAMERRLLTSTPTRPNGEQLIEVAAAAEHLGISTSSIYKMAARAEFPSVKLGDRLLFKLADLAAHAEKHRRTPEIVARLARGRPCHGERGTSLIQQPAFDCTIW